MFKLAEVYGGRPPLGFDITPCQATETLAKTLIVGMWTLMDRYVSPKKWHKMKS